MQIGVGLHAFLLKTGVCRPKIINCSLNLKSKIIYVSARCRLYGL